MRLISIRIEPADEASGDPKNGLRVNMRLLTRSVVEKSILCDAQIRIDP